MTAIRNNTARNATILHRFWAEHPFWQGEVRFYLSGRMERLKGEEGTFELEIGKRVILKWDHWKAEELVWDETCGLYRSLSKQFTLQEIRQPILKSPGPSFPVDPNCLIVGALSCENPLYQNRRKNCARSWLPILESIGVEVLFLVGVGDRVDTPQIVLPEVHGRIGKELWIPCSDDYISLPQKTAGFCRWVIDNRNVDYLFKCDDDTYIVPRRLLSLNVVGADYLGFDWLCSKLNANGQYASGGAGYFLSRRAVSRVANHMTISKGAEDVEVGKCMVWAGFELFHEARLIPLGDISGQRPQPNNDIVTTHACEAAFVNHEATWKSNPAEFSVSSSCF